MISGFFNALDHLKLFTVVEVLIFIKLTVTPMILMCLLFCRSCMSPRGFRYGQHLF